LNLLGTEKIRKRNKRAPVKILTEDIALKNPVEIQNTMVLRMNFSEKYRMNKSSAKD